MLKVNVTAVHALSGEIVVDNYEMYRFAYIARLKDMLEVTLGKPLQAMMSSQGALLKPSDIAGEVLSLNADTVSVLVDTSLAVIAAAATDNQLAILRANGSVELRGQSELEDDERPNLSDANKIRATRAAFAVLRADSSVVTWGCKASGGDSELVQGGLTSVKEIFATRGAFAALRCNGSVIAWGDAVHGGDTAAVARDLSHGVVHICANKSAFAALKSSGSVVAWGGAECGWRCPILADVKAIYCTGYAFAAMRNDNSLVAWGHPDYGGDSSSISPRPLANVQRVYASDEAFAALRFDGSVVSWGNPDAGGDVGDAKEHLSSGISQIFANRDAFAALKHNGSVVTWGHLELGGDSSAVQVDLHDVLRISATSTAFAALRKDGSVVTWGRPTSGGDSSQVRSQLCDSVQHVYANDGAFVALKTHGSAVVWGCPHHGGCPPPALLWRLRTNVKVIFSAKQAFAALQHDGQLWSWGGHVHSWT